MQITEQALKEFKELWLKDHPGQTLEQDQLLEMASRVMEAVKLIHNSEEHKSFISKIRKKV